jgi:hypothetical protein
MRTEKEIRDRIAELDGRQKGFSWDDPDRAVHAKTALRAQIKGLKFALGEDEDYNIVGDD